MLLGDACRIRSGVTLRERVASPHTRGTLAVQQRNVTADGALDQRNAMRLATPPSSPHRIHADELVFRSRGPYWSAWAPGDFGEPIVAVAPLFILSPTADIDPRYLAWYINRPVAQRFFAAEAMGSGVKMIPKSVLVRLPVDIPPLATQREIVAAAALAARERDLARHLTDLRFDLASARLDTQARQGAATSTRRSTR